MCPNPTPTPTPFPVLWQSCSAELCSGWWRNEGRRGGERIEVEWSGDGGWGWIAWQYYGLICSLRVAELNTVLCWKSLFLSLSHSLSSFSPYSVPPTGLSFYLFSSLSLSSLVFLSFSIRHTHFFSLCLSVSSSLSLSLSLSLHLHPLRAVTQPGQTRTLTAETEMTLNGRKERNRQLLLFPVFPQFHMWLFFFFLFTAFLFLLFHFCFFLLLLFTTYTVDQTLRNCMERNLTDLCIVFDTKSCDFVFFFFLSASISRIGTHDSSITSFEGEKERITCLKKVA